MGKRNQALRIRRQFPLESVIQFDFKQSDLKDLEVLFVSPSLFETGPRLIVTENTPDKLDLEQFKNSDDNLTWLLIAGSPRADSLLLQSAKKVKASVYVFEGEKELTAFPFLDALLEGKKQTFAELQKLMAEYGAMYILTMIYYGLRRNLLPLPASSFVRQKIIRQKKLYLQSDWIELYYLTLTAEYKIKSGKLPEEVAFVSLIQKITGKNRPAEAC